MQENTSLNTTFFIFFIIRPDGNSAYTKIHEQYPLQFSTDKLLGLISLFSAVNSLQSGIVHPDIVAARKDQIDLTHKTNVKSLMTSTFQIRILDSVSGYKFVLMADYKVDARKLDNKLEEIYKTFVNHVIKAPFFNVFFDLSRNNKRSRTSSSRKKAMRSFTDDIYGVIQKSLRAAVLEQISELNRANADFCAMMRKLSVSERALNQPFSQKLQSMKGQIKDKIRLLAVNVDLLYQLLDRKISKIIEKVQSTEASTPHIDEQLRLNAVKIRQLQQEIQNSKTQMGSFKVQNEYLKNKNIALQEQIESLSKKKGATTNESSGNVRTDMSQQYSISVQQYMSPIENYQHQDNPRNDLTFNNRNTSIRKQIRSEQNSFSSVLIKQQKSFQKSHTSRNNINILPVGCMTSVPEQPLAYSHHKIQECNQSHRLNFLINNLKQAQEQSFVSISSRNNPRDHSNNKSVLSQGVVKKYHI